MAAVTHPELAHPGGTGTGLVWGQRGVTGDCRPHTPRLSPPKALTVTERATILDMCNSTDFRIHISTLLSTASSLTGARSYDEAAIGCGHRLSYFSP